MCNLKEWLQGNTLNIKSFHHNQTFTNESNFGFIRGGYTII